jgi:DNA repair protein RadC
MKNTNRIRNLNLFERPREKLVEKGIKSLTDEELLALILRSGGKNLSAIEVARYAIKQYGNLKSLIQLELEELTTIKNIGIAKATSIKAIGEIAQKIKYDEESSNKIKKINNPKDIYALMYKHLYGKQSEYLYLVSLNVKNIPISQDIVTIGTIDQTLISSREIYKKALSKNAASIILVHNHPSNDPTPSPQDIRVTEMVAETGKKIGIPLIDHIIFTDTTYVSLKSLNLFNTYKFKNE